MKHQPFKLPAATLSLLALFAASPLMAAQPLQGGLWANCKPTINAESAIVIPEQCMQAVSEFVGGFIQIGEGNSEVDMSPVRDMVSSSSDVGDVASSQAICASLGAEQANLQALIFERLQSAGHSNEAVNSIIAETLRQELAC